MTPRSFKKNPPHPLTYAIFDPEGPHTAGLDRIDLVLPHHMYTFGRDGVHFVLGAARPENLTTSRKHCEVVLDYGLEPDEERISVGIRDVSLNGVLVNGRPIKPHTLHRLRTGDIVHFGPPLILDPEVTHPLGHGFDEASPPAPPRHFRFRFYEFSWRGMEGLSERERAYRRCYFEWHWVAAYAEAAKKRLYSGFEDMLIHFPPYGLDEPGVTTHNAFTDHSGVQRAPTPELHIPPPFECTLSLDLDDDISDDDTAAEASSHLDDIPHPRGKFVEDPEHGIDESDFGSIVYRGDVRVKNIVSACGYADPDVLLWSGVYGLPVCMNKDHAWQVGLSGEPYVGERVVLAAADPGIVFGRKGGEGGGSVKRKREDGESGSVEELPGKFREGSAGRPSVASEALDDAPRFKRRKLVHPPSKTTHSDDPDTVLSPTQTSRAESEFRIPTFVLEERNYDTDTDTDPEDLSDDDMDEDDPFGEGPSASVYSPVDTRLASAARSILKKLPAHATTTCDGIALLSPEADHTFDYRECMKVHFPAEVKECDGEGSLEYQWKRRRRAPSESKGPFASQLNASRAAMERAVVAGDISRFENEAAVWDALVAESEEALTTGDLETQTVESTVSTTTTVHDIPYIRITSPGGSVTDLTFNLHSP